MFLKPCIWGRLFYVLALIDRGCEKTVHNRPLADFSWYKVNSPVTAQAGCFAFCVHALDIVTLADSEMLHNEWANQFGEFTIRERVPFLVKTKSHVPVIEIVGCQVSGA